MRAVACIRTSAKHITLLVMSSLTLLLCGCTDNQVGQSTRWLRKPVVAVETTVIGTVPPGSHEVRSGFSIDYLAPAQQHMPITFSSTYDDFRIVETKNNTVSIRGPKGVVHEKKLDKEFRLRVIRFSPNLDRFAYVAQETSDFPLPVSTPTIVVTDVSDEAYDAATAPVFSADGRHVVYMASKHQSIVEGVPRELQVVLDGKIIAVHNLDPSYRMDPLRHLAFFNPVTNSLAYIIRSPNNTTVMYDGKEFATYPRDVFIRTPDPETKVLTDSPVFSSGGSTLAYMLMDENTVVCKGSTTQETARIVDFTISAKGGACGHIVNNRVIVDGKIIDKGLTPFYLQFSLDGKAAAYKSGGDFEKDGYVWFQGERIGPVTLDGWGFLRIAPDNSTVAFDAYSIEPEDGTDDIHLQHMHVGSEIGMAFDANTLSAPIFLMADHLVVYSGGRNGGKYVMVGSAEIGPYDDVWPIAADSDHVIVFGARDGNNLMKVRVKIDEAS